MKKRVFKIYFYLSIIFLIFFISLSCEKTNSYLSDQDVLRITKDIIPDAGVISSYWEGKSKKGILIFEEAHNSRVGRIELALMLTRLHNRYNVNTIALEGAFASKGDLNTKWFYKHPDKYIREEVALQLLREGEINAAEFVALTIPEVKVYGVEKEEEYTFELSPLDQASATIYLVAIAEKLFPKDQDKIAQFNRLSEESKKADDKDKQKKLKKFINYVINTNQWTKERYKNLEIKDKIVSIEETLTSLNEIRTKAEEVDADIGKYKNNFNRLIEFYERASKRTETMIANTLKLSNGKQEVIIPIVMGAAHTTKASEILRKQGKRGEAIRPISLAEALAREKDIGDLPMEAFKRKQKKLSIDDRSGIGALLDGRWNPPSVFDEIWFRSKSELKYISIIVAGALKRGDDRPPFRNLRNEFTDLRYVKIDRESFMIIGDELIFKAEVQTNDPTREETIWVRTVMIADKEKEKTLEEKLQEILREAREKGIPIEGIASFTQQEYQDFIRRFPRANQALQFSVESINDRVYINTGKISDEQRESLEKEALEEIVEHVKKDGLKIEGVSRDCIAIFSKDLNVIKQVSLSG